MPTTIPQPYGPGSINTDAIGDEVAAGPTVTVCSTASPSSSLLFSSSSVSHSLSGRMTSIPSMPRDVAALHHQHQSQNPPSTIAHAGGPESSGSYYHQATRPQELGGPLFALDALVAGVEHHHYHGRSVHHDHHRHPPPTIVPAPPTLLPSQHDILHTTLNDAANTPIQTNAQMDARDAQYLLQSATVTANERTNYPGPQAPTSPRPKRRGRRPKSYYLSSSDPGGGAASTVDEFDADGNSRDPRRNRVLERNRIAATRCRVRKRDEAEALASREKDMEDQNRQLSTCLDSLAAEVYHLKNELLRHADCDCVLIQKYIANQARRSVDSMLLPLPGSSTSPPSSQRHQRHLPMAPGSVPVPVPVAPIGGESASPYPYNARLGSSTGSSADSVSLRGAEDDVGACGSGSHGQILWANPFAQTVAASPSNGVPPPPPLSMPQRHMESSPAGALTPANMMPRTSVGVAEYSDTLSINTGSQLRRGNDVGWDYQWNYH